MIKKRVCAYCRVSTKSDDQENSFENQKSYFERVISENEKYEFVEIYADRGITGTSLTKRHDFNRMLTDAGLDIDNGYKIIGNPKFDKIMTKNTSRFARNVSVDVILKALAKNKVYVYFLDLDKSTENSDDITYIQLFQTFDERESRDKSKKTKFGMIEGAKKGVILCHKNIYGYKYNPCPINTLEIIEHEAEIVKIMFEMYLDGIGAYRIASTLTQKGIFNRSGKPFTEGAIRAILKNEKYCGLATRMKYDTGTVFEKHSSQIRPKEEQIIFSTDKIPAIVSIEEFDRVQEIRNSKIQHIVQHDKETGKGINHGSTDYAGKIFCGYCGTQYRASSTKHYKNKSTRYYACVKKRQMLRDENGNRIMLCNNPNVTEQMLDNELNSLNYSFLLHDNIIGAIVFLMQIKRTLKQQLDNSDNSEIIELQSELNTIENKIMNLLELITDGVINREIINRKAKPFQEKADEIKNRLTALTKPKAEKQHDLDEINDTIERLNQRCTEIYDSDNDMAIKEHSRKEILQDIKFIFVDQFSNLSFVFNSFDDIRKIIEKHTHILPNEIKEQFSSYATNGNYDSLTQMYSECNIEQSPKESLTEILKKFNAL